MIIGALSIEGIVLVTIQVPTLEGLEGLEQFITRSMPMLVWENLKIKRHHALASICVRSSTPGRAKVGQGAPRELLRLLLRLARTIAALNTSLEHPDRGRNNHVNRL